MTNQLNKTSFDFSVLLAFYNNERTIEECLYSLINNEQGFTIYYIIVDDCSTDNSHQIALEYLKANANNRFKIIKNLSNYGLGYSLQRGLIESPTELIFRMDADDISLPGRFKLQYDYMKSNPEIDVLGGSIIYESEHHESTIINNPKENSKIKSLLPLNPISHPTVCFRKKSVLMAGGYSYKFRKKQDLELWYRMAKMDCKFANIHNPVIRYRFSPDSWNKLGFKASFLHLRISLYGSISLKQTPIVYILCFYPLFRSVTPPFIRNKLHRYQSKLRSMAIMK